MKVAERPGPARLGGRAGEAELEMESVPMFGSNSDIITQNTQALTINILQ